jgi:arabinan endo-1,5-alpha-L-arabinosidase
MQRLSRRLAMALGTLATALSLSSTSPPASAAFWELSGDVGVHDPSIIKEGSAWYTFSTGQGIQVLKSDSTGRQ